MYRIHLSSPFPLSIYPSNQNIHLISCFYLNSLIFDLSIHLYLLEIYLSIYNKSIHININFAQNNVKLCKKQQYQIQNWRKKTLMQWKCLYNMFEIDFALKYVKKQSWFTTLIFTFCLCCSMSQQIVVSIDIFILKSLNNV